MEGPALMTTHENSTGVEPAFTQLECDVIERLVRGDSHKRIARELEKPLGTINRTVTEAAAKLPGAWGGRPSLRLTRWFWHTAEGSTEALRVSSSSDSE